ncbi:uncharacterized protein Z519_08525 [Cladophialophora bantiana CBS 173.52]|uniref:Uncharacterized protein n=1 Tax=Cladophialophora bantiana (strain ATCC 10958 / CBS 173.52 / CDC B-1940 / NIH 8579) TaxID=1442370 RepID=A0A0D2FW26_CLAB1|nr:uncharacterized protein Z519_08525 [Cladophialophora bantiana CBS 173.52]KIW90742.1 hypothetical protein Z519_08525 [Cladophialophora bantiana CBS 173.52]
MFQPEERCGKYSVVSETAWSPPPKRQAKLPKYYAPFSTRWPALTLILLVVLACIAALEYGLRSGLTLEEKNQQQNHSRLRVKRQDADVSSSPAVVVTTPATTEVPSTSPASQDVTTPRSAAASPAASTSPVEESAIDSSSDVSPTEPTSTMTTVVTGSVTAGAYIDPATPSAADHSSTTPRSSNPISSPSTSYITPATPQNPTTPVTSTIAFEITTKPIVSSSTAPYIVPSTVTPAVGTYTSTTTMMAGSTTPYILQMSSTTPYIVQSIIPPTVTSSGKGTTSTVRYSAHTQTSGAYVQQSTTSINSAGAVVKQSASTKSTNPYTVPSSGTTSRMRTTTPMAGYSTASGLGDIRTAEPMSPSIYATGSNPVVSKTDSNPSKIIYGDGHTVSAPTPSGKPSDQQFTVLITYATEDSAGKPFTTVAAETYDVAVITEMVYDSTGGVSTVVATLISYSGTITPTILAQSTSLPTAPPDHQRADEVELGLAVTNVQYFRATYLPVLIAVILKLIWAIVFTSTKMMEPFYLLSRKKGAAAKESLLADYLTTSFSVEGIKNMFFSHPVVTLVSLVYICVNALPAIATQSSTVRATAWCRTPDLKAARCNPMWYLNINYARALEAILSLVALIILLVIMLSSRRCSGIFSNPSSIATMASLLSSEDLMEELRRIDQKSNRSSAKQVLDPYRYIFSRHQTGTGYMRYGIVRAPRQSIELTVKDTDQQEYSALVQPRAGRTDIHNSRSTLSNRFLTDTLFLLSILALLGVLIGYYLDGQDDPLNNYFNHNPTSRLVLTAAASLLDIRWKQLEREVRLLTPYRRLFRGSAKPESTILVSQNSTPLKSIFPALWRRNFFHAFVALVATLSDVLIIAIGGVPWNAAQIWLGFLVSIYASWAILALMALTVIAIFRWRALNEKMMMPHEPTTVLTVWLMLCNDGNQLREEMQGYETMSPKERDDRIKMRGGLYWAGWLTQPDGSRRWCLEKESGQESRMNMMYEHDW